MTKLGRFQIWQSIYHGKNSLSVEYIFKNEEFDAETPCKLCFPMSNIRYKNRALGPVKFISYHFFIKGHVILQ